MNYSEYSSNECEREQARKDRRSRELAAGLTMHDRLLCNGIVIASSDPALGGLQSLEYFKDHLFNALTDPDFNFDISRPMSGSEYIKFHEDRLGVKLSINLEIVGPGEHHPLAPNKEAII